MAAAPRMITKPSVERHRSDCYTRDRRYDWNTAPPRSPSSACQSRTGHRRQSRGESKAMANSTVLLERDGPIARVILNRPEVLNAVNRELIAGIRDAFGELKQDHDVRVIILTGAGRGFSSGGDLKKAPEAA